MAKTTNQDRQRKRDRGERAPSEFTETTLSVDRVTRVVKGGRRMRFRAVVVVGNRKGKVGLGTGKANEVQIAVNKAIKDAKRNMVRVPLTKGTIPHDVDVKFKAARLRLMPASEGTGVIAGGALRVIFDHAGIRNVLAKRFGTGNTLVNAQATFKALQRLKPARVSDTEAATTDANGEEIEKQDKSVPQVKQVSRDQVVEGNLVEKPKKEKKTE
ncbi:MAG TPA: 30S ribosomal protein S5 [Candidatus Peribacteraceae bacterium]|nr:30S ribosomal protein S5 [Candidatus Peribacteraceae bacterium]